MEENQEIEVNENQEKLDIEVVGDETEKNDEDGTYPPFEYDKLTDEEKARIDEINDLIKAEKIDPTTAINILINAVQVSYDKEHFNDLDRYLIAKSLTTFKDLADKGEDIVIKTT